MSVPPANMRIDKWLWAARFFKTRALAVKACEINRILANTQPAKPSRLVKPGDTLQITNDAGLFTIEILALSEARGSASVAAELFRESEASRQARAAAVEERKQDPYYQALAQGRPSKRDRRKINHLHGNY